jgi:hypothetical protein
VNLNLDEPLYPTAAATSLERAEWAYHWCDRTAGEQLPYVSGGGHGVRGSKPFPGIPPTGSGPGTPKGYDCSGAVSGALWWAGCLEHQEALVTGQFELAELQAERASAGLTLLEDPLLMIEWGEGGAGEFVTVCVLDSRTIHHCFLLFSNLGARFPHKVFMAAVPETTVGWYDEVGPDWISLFNKRHPKGG